MAQVFVTQDIIICCIFLYITEALLEKNVIVHINVTELLISKRKSKTSCLLFYYLKVHSFLSICICYGDEHKLAHSLQLTM